MIKKLIFATIGVVISVNISFADTYMTCSKKDAIKAEELAAKATNWNQLYKLYKRYHQCDDGAIAEGFSESVSIILSQSWGQLKDLLPLIQKDARFETFVLNHLDETLPEERIELIGNLATNSCPDSARNLCDNILRRLKQF